MYGVTDDMCFLYFILCGMEGAKLIHEELSYIIRGILYEVHNELGQFLSEKQYCDCIEVKLKERGIEYIREYVIPVVFEGERPGRSRADFLVAKAILLEIKVVPHFSPETFKQCRRYITSCNMDLLLLVNFFYKSTVIKRVLNPNFADNI